MFHFSKQYAIIACTSLIFFADTTGTTAKDISTRAFPVGKINGVAMQGIVETTHRQDEGGTSGYFTVKVYYRQKGSLRKTNRFDAGESYHKETTHTLEVDEESSTKIWAGAYSFTGSSHKQLLVSTRLGRVCSCVYDYDPTSKKLHPIYAMEDGRVVVRPKRNRAGQYDLEEYWTKNQWGNSGIANLGIGHYDSATDYVRRVLYWNGKRFIPYHPGPSSILKQAAKS